MLLHDETRLALVRQIRDKAPLACRVINYFDEKREKLQPMCYELDHDDIIVYVNCVFGNYSYYQDKTTSWSVGYNPLPVTTQAKADQFVLASHDRLVTNKPNQPS